MTHSTRLKANKPFKARKATYGLITKIKQLNLTIEVSIELFELLIIPTILYEDFTQLPYLAK